MKCRKQEFMKRVEYRMCTRGVETFEKYRKGLIPQAGTSDGL